MAVSYNVAIPNVLELLRPYFTLQFYLYFLGYVTLGGNRETVETKTLQSFSKWADTLTSVTAGLANRS